MAFVSIFVTHKNPNCGSGVIGSRTRLRIWRRKAWGLSPFFRT